MEIGDFLFSRPLAAPTAVSPRARVPGLAVATVRVGVCVRACKKKKMSELKEARSDPLKKRLTQPHSRW